jgi:amino acid adenylation domain-containing protein
MLNLLPSSATQFAGSPATSEWIHSGEWNESLTLQIQKTPSGDRLYFDMNRELFRENLARRAPEHFGNMLAALCEHPDRPLCQIDLLTGEECELLRSTLSNPGRTPESHETIVSHFEAAVVRCPESTAVVEGARQVDYRTLNGMANRLAAYLRLRGVKPGDRVGVCMPRSIERIVAIVAILKAGAAYVPVDETWPAERIRVTLHDAAVRQIVAKGMRADGLPAAAGQDLIDVDESAGEVGRLSGENVPVKGSPSAVAYINFTSGSTGRPKGVLVPHSGVIRLTVDADYVELDERTVTLQMSSISFDASTFEIWGALLAGGRLVLPSETLPGASSIRRYIEEHGVTTLFVTTSLFNALIDEDPRAFFGARQLFTGGEAASTQHLARAAAALPDTKLLHVYGPTECTTFSTCYEVPRDLSLHHAVPIGKPISNTSAYVLDQFLLDVPVGAAGELYISGSGVALGYAAQPELSEERFVTLPSHADARAYRTGDIVQLREDGQLVFLGRRDNQVKVRGFRIEIDEVELALNAIPEVRRAVVTLHAASESTKGLAAYVVPAQPDLTIAGLRSALRRALPENMMPRWFVLVDSLPLGSSGKVDRRRLPDPSGAGETPISSTRPRDALEQRLALLWADVLGVTHVSVDANFFDLGGDSIRAIQLAARAASTGLCFEASQLFQFQTVAELADAVRDGATVESIPAKPDAAHDPGRIAKAEFDAILSELEL